MSWRSPMSSGSTQSRSATPNVTRMPVPGCRPSTSVPRSAAPSPLRRWPGATPNAVTSPSAVATATPTSDDPATAPTIRDPSRAAATSRARADATSTGLTTRGANDSESSSAAPSVAIVGAWATTGAGGDDRSASVADHQPRSSATTSNRGSTVPRTRARTPSDSASAAACSAPTGRPAFGASSKVDGMPGVPNPAASASHRSRHAAGVSTGASRCAPASHVSAHARGTTR